MNRLARLNVALLSLGQCFYMTSAVTMLSFTGLVGHMLAAHKSLATLPVSMVMIGAASMTVPASFFMRRLGRRAGFLLGICCSIVSGALGATAILHHSFPLFCCAGFIQGIYQAFSQYYRFAAIDVSTPENRGKAVSYVLGGGIGAALIAPTLAQWSNAYFAPVTFMGVYVLISLLGVIALIPISFIKIKPQVLTAAEGRARPLIAIMRQPVFICATVNAAVGYALMSLMMTAAPLAIVACGFSYKDAGQVIQWHVLAMFLPSLFSGRLIQKLGTVKFLYLGALLYFFAAISALTGESIHHFGAAMIFLGMAWNFMFVSATTLLAQAYGPAEKAKIQGLNELLVFGTTASASLAAGVILNLFGWRALSFALLGLLGVALMATSWYALSLRRSGKGAAIPASP